MTSSKGPILGLGTDIIEIERIRDSIDEYDDKFLERLFTPKEIEYCKKHRDPAIRFAGRFAAKEAIAKALGTGFGKEFHWHDVEILNNELGKPFASLTPEFKKLHEGTRLELSISHCKSFATATSIWIRED